MISFTNGKTSGVTDTGSSVKWQPSLPHPQRVWDPQGTRLPRAALPSCPSPRASAGREQAQVCSSPPSDPQPLLAGPSSSPDPHVPTCHTDTSAGARPPPADSGPEASKVGRVQRETLGARGIPGYVLPSAGLRLPPPSPPPDLAVYSAPPPGIAGGPQATARTRRS